MSSSRLVSRRGALKFGGATLAVSMSGLAMPHVARAQPALRVRQDIHVLEAADPNHPIIAAYKTAMGKMIARDRSSPGDKRGWRGQAEIHRDRCPHGNWFFLPWHRAYLLAFEDIIRAESGYDAFALPYWNWIKNPTLPRSFLQAPLLDTTRQFGASDRLTDSATFGESFDPALFQSNVMDVPEFELFAGEIRGQTANTRIDWQKAGEPGWRGPAGFNPDDQLSSGSLEGGPHNGVHSTLGGNMGNFMSPLDPIFWLHHCNVDRLWTVWRQCGRAANRRVTSQSSVLQNYSFNFNNRADFVSPSGAARNFVVRDLESVNRLGYSYGSAGECGSSIEVASVRPDPTASSGRAAAPAARPAAATARPAAPLPPLQSDWRSRAQTVTVATVARSSAPARVALPPAPAAAPATAQGRGAAPKGAPGRAFTVPASGPIPSRVVAQLSGIEVPDDISTTLRVFVNNPGANATTPTTDPSYVNTITFFGHGAATPASSGGGGHAGHAGHAEPHTMTQVVDLTRALNAMRAAGRQASGPIELQLVAVNRKAPAGQEPTIKVSKVLISGNLS